MKLISHRGNINGKNISQENKPKYLINALKLGYDVELDLYVINGILFLGHDEPLYKIDINWLLDISDNIWVHCKNLESLDWCVKNNKKLNYFWHQQDDFTITSKGFIWCYPKICYVENSIAVLPELGNVYDLNKYRGICSDFIINYK